MSAPPPHRRVTPPDPAISDSIRIARVLGILGLVMIHVPPWHVDLGDPPRPIDGFDLLFLYCQELFGRASVPLLSVISGYLMTRLDAGLPIADRLAKKARTLLVPLLCWNMVAVAIGAVLDRALPAWSPLQWADELVALTSEPAIHPLYFLRDMFLCALLYPVLRALLDRAPGLTLTAVLLLSMTGFTRPLFIGSGPLLFFSAGVAIALGKLAAKPSPTGRWLIAVAALLAPAFTTAVTSRMLIAGTDRWLEAGFTMGLFAERLFGAWAVWMLAGWTLRRRWAPTVLAIEPMIFLIFCSHVLWLGLAWHLLSKAGIGYGHPLYPIFFLTAPLQALAAGAALHALLARFAPGALPVLCGGRMGRAGMPRPKPAAEPA